MQRKHHIRNIKIQYNKKHYITMHSTHNTYRSKTIQNKTCKTLQDNTKQNKTIE